MDTLRQEMLADTTPEGTSVLTNYMIGRCYIDNLGVVPEWIGMEHSDPEIGFLIQIGAICQERGGLTWGELTEFMNGLRPFVNDEISEV